MNIREKNGMFVCKDCSYVYSSMLGDDEIPENCDQCYVYDRDFDDCPPDGYGE